MNKLGNIFITAWGVLFVSIFPIFLTLAIVARADEVTAPCKERCAFEELVYVPSYNIVTDCSTKAKNILVKKIDAYSEELSRCTAPEPTATPTVVPTATATPTATPTPEPTPTATPVPSIPEALQVAINRWDSNMRTFGEQWCFDSDWSEQGAWYYDAVYAYQKIKERTGDAVKWQPCINHFLNAYKVRIDTPGNIPARQAWAEGLELQGEYDYIEELLNGVTYSNLFHNCSDPDSSHQTLVASRAIAFTLRNLIVADRNGKSSPWTIQDINPTDQCSDIGNTHQLVADDALAFVKWHATRYVTDTTYVQSFMAGLTASALIEYDEEYGDPEILPLVKSIADWLWDNAWIPSAKRFRYCTTRTGALCLDPDDDKYSVDLNLLIAPMYSWLYKEGAGQVYADRFDEIFIAGTILDNPDTSTIEGVNLGVKGKTFSQNYKESFRALEWRLESI